MLLYIDPGTGSMLFTILIGVIGTLLYFLQSLFFKLKFTLSGGKKEQGTEELPFVIFSDSKRYWNIFEPICREFEKRGKKLVYMTVSPDDPALDIPYSHVECRFIGEGNRPFSRMNFLKARIVLSSTPSLDVFQWKRSKGVRWYVHILHAANDATLYRLYGTDYFDAVLLSGEYQIRQIRDLEEQRQLPAKELKIVGLPHMDEMKKRLENTLPPEKNGITVLLAPSWGPNSIFNRYGERIFDSLLQTGYDIIVRPHPQSYTSEKELLENLMRQYPENDHLHWNRDTDNFDVLNRSDILISDFSGVIFDFALIFDRPVIYADTSFDRAPYDCYWSREPLWTFEALSRIGRQLQEENMQNMKELIDFCLQDTGGMAGRKTARDETWQFAGEGARRTVDYLLKKYEEFA